jgi:hippurate hydrolase
VALGAELTELRRTLHRVPELGKKLPKTQSVVREALAGLPLSIRTGGSLSSLTAVLHGGAGPGPAVLLRADMDGLPIEERSGEPFSSTVDGAMHACGHDLHMAGLVGAAKLLCGMADRIAGDVVFMFQPSEETEGGAQSMIDEGVLDAAGERVIAAYALHVTSSGEPYGFLTTRPGPLMAASDRFRVWVRGAGGHGSQPHTARDPIPAACEMVTALQTYVTRTHDVFDPVVITVGAFHAGQADNAIPAEAYFGASIRSFSPTARDRVRRGVADVVRGIAAAYGLEVEPRWDDGYPSLVNDETEAHFLAGVATELFGDERFGWRAAPDPRSEDFSYVLRQVPGAFVFLGACPPDLDPGTAPANHSPLARFDDGVLPDAALLLSELALRRLSR